MFCDVIDEPMSCDIWNHVSLVFSLSHICSLLFRISDGNKPFVNGTLQNIYITINASCTKAMLTTVFLYRSKFRRITSTFLSTFVVVSYTGLMLPKSEEDLRARE